MSVFMSCVCDCAYELKQFIVDVSLLLDGRVTTMFCLVLWISFPALSLLLLYFVWKKFADADLTLLWVEQFGLKPGERFLKLYQTS